MGDFIDLIKKLKSKEIALIISVIVSCVYVVFWVENRYAKIVDTQNEIKQQQDQLKIQQDAVDHAQDQILTIIYALPKEQQEDILNKLTVARNIKPTMGNKLK